MIHPESGLAVIPEHSKLGLPYGVQIIPEGMNLRIVCHIRQVAEQIDGSRNNDEEENTPQGDPEQACDNPVAGTAVRQQPVRLFLREAGRLQKPVCFRPKPDMADSVPGIQQCQAETGVDPDPFAGDGQAHKQPAECQRNDRTAEGFHGDIGLQIPQHEEIRENDEQNGIAVDGRDLRLGQVHAVQGHQDTCDGCRECLFGQLLRQEIDARQHQDSGHRTGETPAERCHAEQGDAPADEHLSERRMGGFIRNTALGEFIAGPRVVDFIKIGAVPPGRLGFPGDFRSVSEQHRNSLQGIRLVNQRRRIRIQYGIRAAAGMGRNGRLNGVPFRIPEEDFIQLQADLFRPEPDIPSAEVDDIGFVVIVFTVSFRILIRPEDVFPFPALALGHEDRMVFRPGDAVFAVRHGKIKHADLAEVENAYIVIRIAEIEDDFFIHPGG